MESGSPVWWTLKGETELFKQALKLYGLLLMKIDGREKHEWGQATVLQYFQDALGVIYEAGSQRCQTESSERILEDTMCQGQDKVIWRRGEDL